MKYLIVAPSWIGDTLMAQPLLMRLKQQPGCIIDVLAPPWVAPVLERMDEVRRVITSPFAHGQLRLDARRALGRQLRAEAYDVAIVLPNSWKSALVPFFAGIPQRIGFRGEFRYGLLNRVHMLDEKAYPKLVERYALLAAPRGDPLPRLPQPRLRDDAGSRRATRRALGLPENAVAVVLCPGAEYGPAKRWPAEYFARLASELAGEGHAVWTVGSARDAEIGARIEALSKGACRNLCGATTLIQALDLIAGARLVVSNDSGLMHVAAAFGRALIALYGSSSPAYTPPLTERAAVLSTGIECSPCFERTCPLGHFRCMLDLLPERVLREARALLGSA